MPDLKTWGPLTVLLVTGVTIVLLVGGATVVTGNYDGDFRQWVDDLKYILGGLGIGVGIGRGIKAPRTG